MSKVVFGGLLNYVLARHSVFSTAGCWKSLSLNFCQTVSTRSENMSEPRPNRTTSEPRPNHIRTTSEPHPNHIRTMSEPHPNHIRIMAEVKGKVFLVRLGPLGRHNFPSFFSGFWHWKIACDSITAKEIATEINREQSLFGNPKCRARECEERNGAGPFLETILRNIVIKRRKVRLTV